MDLETDNSRDLAQKPPPAPPFSAQSQLEWNVLFNAVSDAVCLLDKNHIIRRCNTAMASLFGKTEAEIVGRHCWNVVHGSNTNVACCPVLVMEKTLRRESLDMQIGDNWFQVTVDPILDENGSLFQTVHIVRDITDKKRAEQEIFKQREKLSVTLRSIGDGVITTDTQGRVEFLNSAAETMTGWTNREACGKPLAEVFHIVNEFTRKPCENPVDKVLQTGVVVELANHTLLISRDGREMTLADSGSPIRDENGNVFGAVLIFRDVTEKQKMIDTMQQTQKLDSLGILAGGIAHDFNNLLSGIFGYIDLARMNRDLDPTTVQYLNNAMSVHGRAKNLTMQLLTFSKGGAPVRRSGSVQKLVKECALFALSGSNVTSRFTADDELLSCEFDENQIGQVIDNIVLNAQQAMPMGGTIDVSVRNCRIPAGHHKMLHEGDYIKITVTDTGVGIPRSILSRIFDPFFTTKEKGHGLGLATAYSIIRKHDGSIDVESEAGKGSTFHIYLPASLLASETTALESPGLSRGTGRILLMDDEVFIRDSVSDILRILGYETICTKDGKETLSRFSQDQAAGLKYSAVILDLTIPGGIGGKEVAARIRESDKNIPVIVASGYSEDPAIADPPAFGFSGSIAKPFTVQELGKLLKKLIEKPARAK